MELYKFERLKQLVDEIAPCEIDVKRINLIVKGENFTSLYRLGKTSFNADGIFVEINGISFRRYIYLNNYNVNLYGLPKFHIIACSKVGEIGRVRYVSGSTPTVDVIDRNTGELHTDVKLRLCAYCRDEYLHRETPYDTEVFFNSLEQIEEDNIDPADIRPDGYTWDWDIVSERFRRAKKYTCENCNIQITDHFDWHYIEVHHKNHNKSFNNSENLIALCSLCHCYQDDLHLENLNRRKKIQRKLNSFVEKYRAQLELNPYLKRYDACPSRIS